MEAYLAIIFLHAEWTKTRDLVQKNYFVAEIIVAAVYYNSCPIHYCIAMFATHALRDEARAVLTTFTTQSSNCAGMCICIVY